MLDLLPLIERIPSVTGITTDWGKSKEPASVPVGAEPKIYVGYSHLDQIPQGILGQGESPDPYVYFSEDLSQYFITQLNCSQQEFGGQDGYWIKLYKAVSGWMPYPDLKEWTGILHSGGGVMGLDNGRIWWQDLWRIDFPRQQIFAN